MESEKVTMSLLTKVFILSLVSIVCIRSSAAAASTPLSVYEILESYNFPPGILPKGATGYDLDTATGDFSVYFDGDCKFTLTESSYDLRYKSTVSGRISKNKLENLKGVSVKVLILWLNISEVDLRGDDLEFSVGIVSADFPVENFYEIPQCGCGLDCVNRGEGPNPIRLRGSF